VERQWFYLEGAIRRGPVDLAALVNALLATPEPARLKVWREGLPDWQDAGSVAEVSAKLPPPVPAIAINDSGGVAISQARTIARLYRRLIALFAAQYLLSPFLVTIAQLFTEEVSVTASVVILLVLAFVLGVFAWIVVTGYSLMRAVGTRSIVLRTVAMFVPLVNLFVLLGISARTNRWCQQHGIKVGFLGPSLSAQVRKAPS
jgi:hypothetical protein